MRGCLRVLGGGQSARGSPEPHADRLDCGSGDPRPSHRGASRAQQLGFATRTSHGSSGLSMQCSSTPRPRVLAPDGRPGLSLPVYLLAANSVLGTCILDAVFAAGPLAAFQSALLIVDPLASIAIGVEPFEELLNNSPLDLLFGCSFAWPCSRGGAHDQVGADPHGSQKQTLTSHDRQRLLTVGRRRRESPSPRLGVSSESTVALCRGGRFRGPVADSEPGLSSAAV